MTIDEKNKLSKIRISRLSKKIDSGKYNSMDVSDLKHELEIVEFRKKLMKKEN